MSPRRPRFSTGRRPDGMQDHLDWLGLVDVSGPFLTLPVLTRVWPTLDALESGVRERLRVTSHHAAADLAETTGWIRFVIDEMLGWGDAYRTHQLDDLALVLPGQEGTLTPRFAVMDPQDSSPKLLGMYCPTDSHPTARASGEAWRSTPADRMAALCKHNNVPLGLVTNGRWWALLWVPPGGVVTKAVFDSGTWAEKADWVAARAFVSVLSRRRFFGVPAEETLPALLMESMRNQEEVTEVLGVQVRRAVEQLVEAISRHDLALQESNGRGLDTVATAGDVYRAAVVTLMRIVFILFAEERRLLPADDDLFAASYSAQRLCEDLERRVSETSEEELEYSTAAWLRLLALFRLLYWGAEHPRLAIPAYDGSVFEPERYAWLESVSVDDRTILHMLRSVQYVQIKRERRRLSFRALDVEQIGYVYEGLLSYDCRRAGEILVGLIGQIGLEEEASLDELELLAAGAGDGQVLAQALVTKYQAAKLGSTSAVAKRIVVLGGPERAEAMRLLLAATGSDWEIAERLLPFFGLIRRDLRGIPVVIMPGSLYVALSAGRKNSGAHYTPRDLAERVARDALEPLVYSPGPLQEPDEKLWALKSSTDILKLRVADISVGSGAFLVAACRYLGERLLEAWALEGDIRAREHLTARQGGNTDAESDVVTIQARRHVIQNCLYGVDINPMAIEIAKLSLWLVSLDPRDLPLGMRRPFTFLEDRLVVGDSLLGVTTVEQLETMHLDPVVGRALHDRAVLDFTASFAQAIRGVLEDAAERRQKLGRQKLAGTDDVNLATLAEKRQMLATISSRMRTAMLFADLTIGAALAAAGKSGEVRRETAVAAAHLAWLVGEAGTLVDVSADSAAETGDRSSETKSVGRTEEKAHQQARRWLDTDLPEHGPSRQPLHWPLVFPEVFTPCRSDDGRLEPGGFDAILGNQPYLGGQKLTGVLGHAYRETLVRWIGNSARGSADLVAYFVLRTHELLNNSGQAGLIATNTLAQGDTREVGLDPLISAGVEIRKAVKSAPWPGKVGVHYCAISTSRARLSSRAVRQIDGAPAARIGPTLDPLSRATGNPYRLAENRGIAFMGSTVLGLGFMLEPSRVQSLLRQDPANQAILFPYLTGQDANSRPDCSASRWVINFHDWSQERASTYRECFDQVVRLVKPERAINADRRRREIWWRFTRPAVELYAAIEELNQVIVITLVSKAVMPVMVPAGQVFSHALDVFTTDAPAMLALLSSAPHYWWAISRASTMKGDVRYTSTDVFETFARPAPTLEVQVLGERLDAYRRELMLARRAGLTATYNLVHDPACGDEDIAELRDIHRGIDEAVVRAYGWDDLANELSHGFQPTRQGTRYTLASAIRQEMLDRLLELNHVRHAEEQESVAERGSQRPLF